MFGSAVCRLVRGRYDRMRRANMDQATIFMGMHVRKSGSTEIERGVQTDSQNQVKVFLVMASPDEIGQLHKSLSTRVTQAKLREETSAVSKVTEAVTVTGESLISEMEPEICTPDAEEDNQSDTGFQDGPEAQTAGNPVVIVSAEDDEDSNQTSTLKRPLDSEDHHEQSKKACTESISNVPQLLNK